MEVKYPYTVTLPENCNSEQGITARQYGNIIVIVDNVAYCQLRAYHVRNYSQVRSASIKGAFNCMHDLCYIHVNCSSWNSIRKWTLNNRSKQRIEST